MTAGGIRREGMMTAGASGEGILRAAGAPMPDFLNVPAGGRETGRNRRLHAVLA